MLLRQAACSPLQHAPSLLLPPLPGDSSHLCPSPRQTCPALKSTADDLFSLLLLLLLPSPLTLPPLQQVPPLHRSSPLSHLMLSRVPHSLAIFTTATPPPHRKHVSILSPPLFCRLPFRSAHTPFSSPTSLSLSHTYRPSSLLLLSLSLSPAPSASSHRLPAGGERERERRGQLFWLVDVRARSLSFLVGGVTR